MFLNSLINLVRNLFKIIITAFSGRKRNSLKTNINSVPKGMISMIARM